MVKAFLFALGMASVCVAGPVDASLPSQAVEILKQRCLSCHGDGGMSGLTVRTREQLLKGGSRGAAVQPGKPESSLLMDAVQRKGKLAMPPSGKIADAEIAILRDWIADGAAWPTEAASHWWAFVKPERPAVPRIAGATNPIDAFISEKLSKAGIDPAPEAERPSLLKRAYYDLTGLPPTAKQIQDFVNDKSPDAWERVIDSLLASKRYGEKWGGHWLDLVRYGDTAGFEQDPYILDAYRYRDYVIKSFNDDKPYDRFAKEQIAGDQYWPDDGEARTGTAFYRVNTNRDMLFKVEDLNATEKLTDAVETTSMVFLGLTVGCARCHDHKFDPIPQRDFYRMQAIFAPMINDKVALEYNDAKFYDVAANYRDFELRQIGENIARIERPYREQLRKEKIAKLSPDLQAILAIAKEKRTPEQEAQALSAEEKLKFGNEAVMARLSQADAERLHAIEKKLLTMYSAYAPGPTAPGVVDVGREAPRTFIAIRGNTEMPGEEVGPGYLTALGGGDIPDPPLHAKVTGRRKALAEWLASADNPLFARVMVNRIWQDHFGAGLLRTPSDFGTRAGQPSHPELLDWLATEFVARKWSMKEMHRLIMTSQAYRRSADASPVAKERDAENIWLSHMNRRRLQWEEIRDSVLQVGGHLNLKMGGIPVVPPLDKEELFGTRANAWPVSPDPQDHLRRSVYLFLRRTFQQPMAAAFDGPEGSASCPRRNESTTAPQSLALLNSGFIMEQATAIAASLQESPEAPINGAWVRVLGRAPSAKERDLAAAFIEKQAAALGSKEAAYRELVRGLFNSNEFLYVD